MKISFMQKSQLSRVDDLYKDANKFTSKSNIAKWTARDLKKFPKLHLVATLDNKGGKDKKNKKENNKKEKIIGAISGTIHSQHLGYIEDISVDKKYRGHKVGDKLLKHVLRVFHQLKIKHVELWIHWTDARAIPFYYRHGFRIVRFHRTKGMKDVADDEDILILKKKILSKYFHKSKLKIN